MAAWRSWKCDWDAVDESAGMRELARQRRHRDNHICNRCGLDRDDCVCDYQHREDYAGTGSALDDPGAA